MKEIYAIINQKGGVGKSTTAHALGCALTRRGFRVLFVDLDSQGNLSFSLRAQNASPTAMEVLAGDARIGDAVVKTAEGDLLPAGLGLALAEQHLSGVGSEFRLREALEEVLERYDYIVIDTPPALGTLTVNALAACTRAVIPAQADIYSFQGVSQLYKTLSAVKRYCNPKLSVAGILLTRYSPRAILSRDVADMLKKTAEQIGTRLFASTIREAVSIKEAQANQLDVYTYNPKSKVSQDYEAFTDELLRGE